MTVKDKLEEYDLFDQAIIRHGILDVIRDYEVIGYLSGLDFDSEVQYVFKGCIKIDYKVKVAPENYSMDDRLLDLDRQIEPDYPAGFVWGAKHAVVYPGWTLTDNTDELNNLGKMYGLKFYQIYYSTNAYDLIIVFQDVKICETKRIEKKKNAT